MPGKMRLAAYFNPTGHHVASWRHPRAQSDAEINMRHYVEIAQTAERAKFDMIFLADGVATREAHMDALSRSVQFVAHFEPLTLLVGARDGDRAHRPRRDRIDDLQRALSHRPQVRLARPHQRRPRRLEHRDLGAERPRRAISAATGVDPHDVRYERAAEFVRIVDGAVG